MSSGAGSGSGSGSPPPKKPSRSPSPSGLSGSGRKGAEAEDDHDGQDRRRSVLESVAVGAVTQSGSSRPVVPAASGWTGSPKANARNEHWDKGPAPVTPPRAAAAAAGPSSSNVNGPPLPGSHPSPSLQSLPRLRTPGGSGVYLKLPLRGPRGGSGSSPVRQQPTRRSAEIGKTVSMNRLNSQTPLGGDRPIPPLTGASTFSILARGDSRGTKGSSHSHSSEASDYDEEGGGGRAANLSLMYGTDYVFARKCGKFPEELQAYQRLILKREIINSSGRRIYFSGQMLNKWKWCRHQFTYHVFDQAGRVAIITKGVQLIPGITASATIYENNGATLGTITQDYCDSGYTVKDREGHPQFIIRGPCYGACTPCVFWCFDEHFEVDLEDGVTEIGMISNNWKKTKTKEDQRGLWGLHFPIGLENRQKALLLGAAFLIHFQFYRRGGNGVWICILLAIVIGLGAGLWFGTDGFGTMTGNSTKIDSFESNNN